MREQAVEAAVVRQALAAGGLAVKHVSPGRAGDPDRLVAIPRTRPCPACGSAATVALIEVKRPGQRPRPLQEARMAQWAGLGVRVSWVSTPEEARRAIEELKA